LFSIGHFHPRLPVNDNRYRPTAATALILSQDSLAAALLGAAIELVGHSIAFAATGESLAQSFRRIRPAFLLVDAGDDAACAAELLGPALMTGTRTILFGGAATVSVRRDLASKFQLDVLVMPRDLHRLGSLLTPTALNRAPAR
jgi:hypothetical protein